MQQSVLPRYCQGALLRVEWRLKKTTGVRRKRLDANLGKRRCTTPWPREWLGKRGPASHGAHAASDGMVSVFKFVSQLFQIIIVTVAQSFTT